MKSSPIEDYLNQVKVGNFIPITNKIYRIIKNDGWVAELELFGYNCNIQNFEYIILNLSASDKTGLQNLDDDVVDAFNIFDIKLKDTYKNTVDFIDYDKGVIHIVRLKDSIKQLEHINNQLDKLLK